MTKWMSDDDWVYEVSEDGIGCTIRKYNGKKQNIIVPEKCGGYSVVALGNDVSTVFTYRNVKTVALPSTITEIKSCAFLFCDLLEEVVLPSELVSIGNSAFYGCVSLKHIEFPINVSCIEYKTFCCCESLTFLNIPANIKKIEPLSFLGCCRLEKILLQEGLESIGHHAFSSTSITEVELPNSIINVENDSFDSKVALKRLRNG